MADFPLTPSQDAAIHTVDRSVLVSAGAGSGKTAVLAERCAHLVAELKPSCDVNELLVVTFTEAAAAEMRRRIERALRERLAGGGSRLERQLALLESASISTLHSFCKRVLNRYFAQAGLDPRAPQLDEQDIAQLRREAGKDVFDRLAARDDPASEAFLRLLETYGGGGEDRLLDDVLDVQQFLDSVLDPERWLGDAAARWILPPESGLGPSWLNKLIETVQTEIHEQERLVIALLASIDRDTPPFHDELADGLRSYSDALASWASIFAGDRGEAMIDRFCERVQSFKWPALPRKPSGKHALNAQAGALFECAKTRVVAVRDTLCEERMKTDLGRFTSPDWIDGIRRAGPYAAVFLDLVRRVRDAYQDRKRDLGAIDFADLERMTLNLLRAPRSGVVRRLRDQYRFVLVDEFQDINPVQAEILRLISREESPERAANLFSVGDVKQSIYRFRLAEPRLFLDRRDEFGCAGADGRGRAIDLVENFRSSPRLIEAINAIFERIMAADLGGIDYDEHARLKAGRSENRFPGEPAIELHLLPTAPRSAQGQAAQTADAWNWEQIEREGYLIAERIRSLAAGGTAYGDMVILLRAVQTRAGLLVRTLERLGVPVLADVTGGFFDAIEVLDVLSLLQLIDNPRQDIPLAAALRSPLFGGALSDEDLAAIRLVAAARSTPFHASVRAYGKKGPAGALRDRLRAAFDILFQWRRRARLRPLADVLWSIYEESGYLAFVGGLRHGDRRRANLVQLHEQARRFGRFDRQGLGRFLRFIDGLRESQREPDAGSAAARPDVVRVMTIHRSKGLEFPVVFVAELGKRFNLRSSQGLIVFDRRLGVGLKAVEMNRRICYPTLPHRIVSSAVRDESLAEELRILYVALTRAKERLILVGSGTIPDLDAMRAQLTGHAGPLPLLQRRTAMNMLDWVLPAVCCLPEPALSINTGEGLVAIRTYDDTKVRDWTLGGTGLGISQDKLSRWARFDLPEPSPSAPNDAVMLEVVHRRLTTEYAARAFTRLPAVAAASVIKKQWRALSDDDDPAPETVPSHGFRLDPPRFLSATPRHDAATTGTWTHALLQRLDLARPCDEADLRRQLDGLIESGVIEAPAAEAIDIPAIAWFMAEPMGGRIRGPAARVLREWPFVLGVDPSRLDAAATGADAGDTILVRGIIDCLFEAGDGWEILDYKTDAVATPEQVRARAEEYAGQLDIYAAAVEAAWGRPVIRRALVFLSARRIVEV